MKKLLLLFAVMLSAVGAWAQTTTKVKGEILSAGTLMAKTEPVNIVIQNISSTNRWYFCGNKNLQTYETNSETWFVWEPSGDGETFYLKKLVPTDEQGEGYLQNTSPSAIGAKATAQKFKAEYKYPKDAPEGTADSDNLVRFVRSDNAGTWINCQTTGGTPVYNSGEGAFTMHNVYVIKDVVSAVGDLSNDKVYTLKSGRSNATTSHYLLYHVDAPNNLSSTYSVQGHSLDYSDETSNFHFAIYKSGDKYYFYNIAAAKFIGNNNNNNGAIPLVEIPTNAVEIRPSSNNTYNFVLSTNGTGALNAADTNGCHGVVNWTGGYNNLTDGGNIYQITEVGELDAATKAIIEERIDAAAVLIPARQAVENASDVHVGAYTTAAVATLSEKLDAYDANATTETFEAVKTAYNDLLTNGAKVTLGAGEIFRVKCLDTNRGYMVYSTVEGKGSETQAYLAGTNKAEFHASLDADGIYEKWAVLEVDGKKYIYNVQNKKFITSDNVVKFSETAHALNFVDINNALWEIQFESNNRYLSFSPGWGADCVRTEPGIDDGCKFYLEKVGSSVDESVSTEMEDKINVVRFGAWKADNIAALGYVGGYPAYMEDAINAVTTYSEALAFDADNADKRIVLAEGYYFIKGTGNGNGADWYATYGDDASPAFAAPAIGSETPGVKHIWKFVACENGYKFQACNLDKYVSLANAESTNSGPSPISSDFNGGSKFVFEDQGAGKFVIKDGNGNVMRSEGSGKGYALNYWWGEENESWYIIPATELDITVSEAGWATTCLPFDVVLPEELTAYALTDVSGVNGEETGSVSLISKAGIKANQGALLKGDAGTYTLSIEETSSNWDANLLSGTTVAKDMSAVEGDVYLLTSGGAGSAQLSKLDLADDATDAQKTLAANKAYLNIAPSATRFLVFNFGDDNATAIEGIEAENTADAVVYDLAGRRVQKAQKGLYIVNGKKVIK